MKMLLLKVQDIPFFNVLKTFYLGYMNVTGIFNLINFQTLWER